MAQPTSASNFPTKYKFIDITIYVDPARKIYNRRTYDLLMFAGDMGGLQSAL